MGLRVLLIEDDETIAEPLIEGLRNFGLTVVHVATGAEGLRGPHGDVVLLDLGLPDMDGIDVCRGIRRTSEVPIIILSARGEEADRVLGLELGADDYLAKPFSMRELVARVRAVTRRVRQPDPYGHSYGHEPYATVQEPAVTYEVPVHAPSVPTPSASYESYEPFDSYAAYAAHEQVPATPAPLVVDRRTRQVWVGEVAVALTPKEFELLALLSEDPGAVYSRQQILTRVWDTHYQGPTKTLDVHVATLRRKLGDPAWIQTLRGVGFRLAVRSPGQGPGRRRGGGPTRYHPPGITDAPEAAAS
ncbi:response regulator transcription factor [Streptomyces sp. GTA36]